MEETYVTPKHPVEEIPVAAPASVPTPSPVNSADAVSHPYIADPVTQPAYTGPAAYDPMPAEKPKKSHRGLVIALIIIAVLIVGLGIFGYTQYKAAMRVVDELTADGNTIAANVQVLADAAKQLDYATALEAAKTIDVTAQRMLDRISTKEFDVAARIPKYGPDVLTARELLGIVIDADENAAIPVLQAALDHPLEGLYSSKTGLDVDGLYTIVDAIDAALPVAEKDVAALEALQPFAIPQLRDALAPAFDNIGKLKETLATIRAQYDTYRPLVDSMVGRDGTGTMATILAIAGPILGDRADVLYQSLVAYLKSMITGQPLASDGVDWAPIIQKVMNGEEIDLYDIMQLVFSADEGVDEDGDGGIDLFWLLSLLFGGGDSGDDGDSGFNIFSILELLFGGDEGAEDEGGSGDSGFDIFSLLALLFGDDSDGDDLGDLDGLLDENADDASEAVEDIGIDLFDLLDIFLGDGSDDGDASGEEGDDGGMSDLMELLFGLLLGGMSDGEDMAA